MTTRYTHEQKEIIESNDQHIMVVANAGCGKTFTIIEKIKYLINNKNLDPNKILLTSFSKVANEEILEKLNKELGEEISNQIYLGTIHSICYKIISECKEYLGLQEINIVNESYLGVVAFNITLEKGQVLTLKEIQEQVSIYRRNLVSRKDQQTPQPGEYRLLLQEAQERLEEHGKLLFDDLLIKTVELLTKHETVRRKCQDKFDYIMVDEIQDTSYIQWKIVELFLREETKTCLVGDAKQNIYGFRGASYLYMNDFKNLIKSKVYPLSETFRFGQGFADLSNKVISELDIDSIYKEKTKTNVQVNNKPLFKTGTILGQVDSIIEDVKRKIEQGFLYKDINVLYRYNAESIPFIKAFMKAGIPFKVKSGDLFERPELKFLIAAYNLVRRKFTVSDCAMLFDEYPNYVGHETLGHLYKDFIKDNYDEKITKNVFRFLDFATDLKHTGIGSAKMQALQEVKGYLRSVREYLNNTRGSKINLNRIAELMNIKETKFTKKNKEEQDSEGVKESISFLDMFQEMYLDSNELDLNEWYNKCLLNNSSSKKDKEINAIQLKTIHGSKGQSLPVVYLLLNRVASSFFCKTEEDLLNEAFVLYVGTTRAEKELHLYVENKDKFRFPYLLKNEEVGYVCEGGNTSSTNLVPTLISFKLRDNYLTQKDKFNYKLKENTVYSRHTDKAIHLVIEDKAFWLPLNCVGFYDKHYYVDGWICSKNNLYNYLEEKN